MANERNRATTVTQESFGTMPDGRVATIYILRSEQMEARLTDFGARLVAVRAPDAGGAMGDVVLGYGTLEEYLADRKCYHGAIVGRFANRIASGRFAIDGNSSHIPRNNGANALHGGPVGFDRALWKAEPVADGVEMTLVSPDGDQGFPGTLTVRVRYTLMGETLRVQYAAMTDRPTIVNLTNHAYFNLCGDGAPSVLDHELLLNADRYTPVDANLIPVGGLAEVQSTPFDFTQSTRIGDRIDADDEQLRLAGGYDHNWVVRGAPGSLRPAAHLYAPSTGRTLTVETTEPGIQFYCGNFLDGSGKSRDGRLYVRRSGLCLETQQFPDAPNQSEFPSTMLRPGTAWKSETAFTFGLKR